MPTIDRATGPVALTGKHASLLATTGRSRRVAGGVRLAVCQLPIKSPWLNPIEPKWAHTKRKVVEPDRLRPARGLAERVCVAAGCA
jgi:transposase